MTDKCLPISVVVLTYNEENNIRECLESLGSWAGEVFVVDSGSSDRTLEIVEGFTAKLYHHPFFNYSCQRNWAQDNLPLTYDWVFHVDADERVTPGLVAGLRSFFAGNLDDAYDGILVRRRIQFLGRPILHGGVYPTYHCRVFRHSKGRCEDREYDQHFLADGPAYKLDADLIEVTASSLGSWTARHNRWAAMEATHLLNSGAVNRGRTVQPMLIGSPLQRRRWLRASVYERSPVFLRALIYFLQRYFLRAGFLDGTPGLIYHVLHGFWFRFYVDACYYELKHSPQTSK